jgi:cold shock CspA family protein
MGRSTETFGKKEREKAKLKKQKDKKQKAEERKSSGKGSSFEDMIAYVDEDGNISSTPPDPTKKKKINAEDIEVSVSKQSNEPIDVVRNGKVTFFNESKGYGFILDLQTQESVFVHINGLVDPIKENDKVTFETEMGQKGPTAVKVKKTK